MKTCWSNDTGLEAATSASPVTDELVDVSAPGDPHLTEPALVAFSLVSSRNLSKGCEITRTVVNILDTAM